MIKNISRLLLLFFAVLISLSPLPAEAQTSSLEQLPLLYSGNLKYNGAFRVPSEFNFGGSSLAYNNSSNSLFLTSHPDLLGEVEIPGFNKSSTLNDLNVAKLKQTPVEPTEGKKNIIDSTQTANSGVLVYNNKLILSEMIYYDANGTAQYSHFSRPLNLSTKNEVSNPAKFNVNRNPGYYARYMTPVPSEWQEALGGQALAGNCCVPILSRTSAGPSLYSFNPSDVGTTSPVPANELMAFENGQLGECSGETPTPNWNCSAGMTVVFPANTRSVLFFGYIGTGKPCYGVGGSTRPPDVKEDKWCLDPLSPHQGFHFYPYQYRVWAFDALDLQKVKNGQMASSAMRPYATWEMEYPWAANPIQSPVLGATYNPSTQEIYVSLKSVEKDDCCKSLPVVYSYKIEAQNSTPTPSIPTPVQPSTPVTPPSFQLPSSGSLLKDPSHPAIYIMENGLKRPFVSMEAFTGLGFSLKNVQLSADVNSIPYGAPIAALTERHSVGITILHQGTVYYIDNNSRRPFPSAAVFLSWHPNGFGKIVPANNADLAVPIGSLIEMKP